MIALQILGALLTVVSVGILSIRFWLIRQLRRELRIYGVVDPIRIPLSRNSGMIVWGWCLALATGLALVVLA